MSAYVVAVEIGDFQTWRKAGEKIIPLDQNNIY